MPAQATTARRVTRSAKLLTVGFGPAALSMPSSTSTRSRATRITRNNFAPSSIPAITFTPTTRATRRWPNPSIFRFLIRKNESHRGFRGLRRSNSHFRFGFRPLQVGPKQEIPAILNSGYNPDTMSTWTSGIRLGPHVLVSPIGAGGMGEVWKARDTRLDRIVAVKRLQDQYSKRFEQEARTIAALNHPHICQLYDIGPDYLVMEYIEGKPLQGPFSADQAVRLAIQI